MPICQACNVYSPVNYCYWHLARDYYWGQYLQNQSSEALAMCQKLERKWNDCQYGGDSGACPTCRHESEGNVEYCRSCRANPWEGYAPDPNAQIPDASVEIT